MPSFYVYEHRKPGAAFPFYIGKGSGGRARIFYQRGKHHQRILDSLAKKGKQVDVIIVFDDLTERQAFEVEVRHIAYWREKGARLVNQTAGGDGPWGAKYTEERREKLRKAFRNRKFSVETRRRMSSAQRGKVLSASTRQKLSVSLSGRKLSEEHKLRISRALLGKPKSAEMRQNMRRAAVERALHKNFRSTVNAN